MWIVAYLAACGSEPEPRPPRPSVVLVTLDTTRADRLGSYGHELAHTPHLDRLAAEGVRFERAYTTVPLTTPAHASMLSGLYPPSHGIRTNGDAALPAEALTIAEVLGPAGWRTGASVAAFVTTDLWALDQGFDTYLDDVQAPGLTRWSQERPADAVVDDAVDWLSSGSEPFFLWVHFYDPHEPYDPPAEWLARVGDRPYDGELAFVDDQVGRLREAVEGAAGEAGAAWIVVGDHGEALTAEHGENMHGVFLFDETSRVPLIVRPAQPLPAPRVDPEVVSVVDVWPTAMALAGVAAPLATDGVDLTPALVGPLPSRAPVYVESETPRLRFGWHPEVAVVDEGLKLLDTPSLHLFDLATDPAEATNVAESHADDVARLQRVSAAVRARSPLGVAPAPVGVDAQLEALGYVTTEATGLDATVDAKDRRGTLALLMRAGALAANLETRERAETLYRELLQHEPDLGEARLSLVQLLERDGRVDDAVAELHAALERAPESSTLRLNLGRLQLTRGQADAALDQADSLLVRVPSDRDARHLQAQALGALGRGQEALANVQEWRASEPDDAGWPLLEGHLLLAAGRTADAEAAIRAATNAPVPPPGAHVALANLVATARPAEAMQLLRTEIGLYPDDAMAHRQLGDLRMGISDWAGAASAYSEAALRAPTQPDSRRAWAQAVLNLGDPTGAEEVLAPLLPSDDPHVLTLHANILALSGRTDEAEPVFERAKALWNRGAPQSP